MAKLKSKKKNISDAKNTKSKTKQINPFEVHVNRQKFNVLGRKLKADKGLPGLAKAKFLKKRKETLLQDYKIKDKSNKFVDKRIGERNSAMTNEDKIVARFTAERMKTHNKKTMFNLGDDEVLTHKGRSLAEFESFDDPRSDDESDPKGLDAKFVEEAHFGGGTLSKVGEGRMAVIDQLIADSKKRKAEKAKEKEHTLAETEKLDDEWKDLMPMLASYKKSNNLELKNDKYDMLLGELRFEARGNPQNRLKTSEELATEEANKLSNLEEERLKRMRGDEVDTNKTYHKSADDLDDGLDLDDENEEFVLMYDKDGKPIGLNSEKTKDNDLPIQSESESEENESDEESGSEGPEDLSDLKPIEETKNNNSEDDEELTNSDELKKKKKVSFATEIKTLKYEIPHNKSKTAEELEKERLEIEKLSTQAKSELPFTFTVPNDYEALKTLLGDRPIYEKMIILERMMKCNHPSLHESNKTKLQNLFKFLLRLLEETDQPDCWTLMDNMSAYLFDLVNFSPLEAVQSMVEAINEKNLMYNKKKHKFPSHETFVLLKLVPILFPCSDKRHPVTTPAIILIAKLLRECQITSRRSIASGLFLVSLLTQYISLSKRILPEAVNFLCGIIHMCIEVGTETIVLPPGKKEHKFLYLQNSCTQFDDFAMYGSDLSLKPAKIDDNFRIRSVYTALHLSSVLTQLYKDYPAAWLLLEPLQKNISLIDESRYPEEIVTQRSKLLNDMNLVKEQVIPAIIREQKKPKVLRQYEPDIKPVYENKKRKDERSKLVQQYKKEMKGALREIRRDRTFLASVKFKEQADSDAERLRRVKQIYSWGAEQQGDLNKLDRKKKKKF